MNDNQVDKIMESWKEQRSSKDAQFETEEKFQADFFAKAAELPVEKTAKKTFWPIVCKLAACVAVVLCLAVVLLKLNKKNEMVVAKNVSLTKPIQYETVDAIKEQSDEVVEITHPQAPVVKAVVPKKEDLKPVAKESRRGELLETFTVAETTKEQDIKMDENIEKSVAPNVRPKPKSPAGNVAYWS